VLESGSSDDSRDESAVSEAPGEGMVCGVRPRFVGRPRSRTKHGSSRAVLATFSTTPVRCLTGLD
jgi:hypothetical protein